MSKKSKYKELSLNTLLFTISSFGSKLISFLLVPLYTYTLSTQDYGTVDLLNTTIQLLIPFLTINIQDAVLRFSLDSDYEKDEVIGVGIKITFISSILLAIILYVIKSMDSKPIDNKYLLYLFLSYVFGSLFNIFSMYLKGKNRIKILTFGGVLNTFITCILNVFLLLWLKKGVTGYLLANLSGLMITVIFLLIIGEIYKDVKFSSSKSLCRLMVKYSFPLVLNSLAWWINNASDRYILTYFCGASLNGVYSVAYKIPTILSTIQNIFYSAWSISAITEFDKNDNDGFMGNIYTMYSCVSILGCSILLIGNYYIAQLLYSKDFFVAWSYVPPLLIGTVFNGLALVEGCIFTAAKKTAGVTKTTIYGALVNTLFNFILIPYYGAYGAAFATMIGYFTTWFIRSLNLKSIIQMKVNWKYQILIIILLFLQLIPSLTRKVYWMQIPIMVLLICFQSTYLKNFMKIFKDKDVK